MDESRTRVNMRILLPWPMSHRMYQTEAFVKQCEREMYAEWFDRGLPCDSSMVAGFSTGAIYLEKEENSLTFHFLLNTALNGSIPSKFQEYTNEACSFILKEVKS